MYSCIVEGKVLDYKFKRSTVSNYLYYFFIGDIYIGQIYKMKKSWAGVGKATHKLNSLNGFKTRLDAAEFLLKLEGYE